MIRAVRMQIVRHFESEGFLDVTAAADDLRFEVETARQEGRDVTLPVELAELIAKHLAGELPQRRGRRLRIGDPFDRSWLMVRVVRMEFKDRRANGEKYDALIAELAETLGVSRSTVVAWVSPSK